MKAKLDLALMCGECGWQMARDYETREGRPAKDVRYRYPEDLVLELEPIIPPGD